MAKKRKRSGRVTPKGTKDPKAKARSEEAEDEAPVSHQRDLPDRVRHSQTFGGRPTSHHRGNR